MLLFRNSRIFMYKFFLIISLFLLPSFFPLQCVEMSKDGGIFMSIDGGETWQQKVAISKRETIASKDILSITIDPKDSKIIYLGTRGSGIYKTMDGGEVWYHLKDENKVLSKRANIYDIAIDPKNNSNIYIGAYQDRYGRFFRSRDGGRSWEELYIVSRPKYAIFAVEVDPYNPSIIYIGTAEGGLLKSTDYGKSWRVIKWFDDVISDIKTNPHDTRVVYVSTFRRGIYKTTDEGITWQSFEDVLREFREAEKVEALVMDLQNPNVLYSGSQYGLLKSIDGGNSWQKVKIVIPEETLPILSIAVDPVNSSCIYYGAGSVIYKSLDGGKNWSLYPIPSSKNIKVISINPENPDIIYVGMHK